MTGRRAALLVLVAAATLAAGCGRKGPPLPPRPVVPGAVTGLRAQPEAGGLRLSWTAPARNQDGSALRDLLEFRVSRAPSPGAEGPAGFAFLATVPAEPGDRYSVLDDDGGSGLRPGVRYAYRVQPVNRRGMLGPVAEVSATYTPDAKSP
jgi:hypothetical protein